VGIVELALDPPDDVRRKRAVGIATHGVERSLVQSEGFRRLEESERIFDLPRQIGSPSRLRSKTGNDDNEPQSLSERASTHVPSPRPPPGAYDTDFVADGSRKVQHFIHHAGANL